MRLYFQHYYSVRKISRGLYWSKCSIYILTITIGKIIHFMSMTTISAITSDLDASSVALTRCQQTSKTQQQHTKRQDSQRPLASCNANTWQLVYHKHDCDKKNKHVFSIAATSWLITRRLCCSLMSVSGSKLRKLMLFCLSGVMVQLTVQWQPAAPLPPRHVGRPVGDGWQHQRVNIYKIIHGNHNRPTRDATIPTTLNSYSENPFVFSLRDGPHWNTYDASVIVKNSENLA